MSVAPVSRLAEQSAVEARVLSAGTTVPAGVSRPFNQPPAALFSVFVGPFGGRLPACVPDGCQVLLENLVQRFSLASDEVSGRAVRLPDSVVDLARLASVSPGDLE